MSGLNKAGPRQVLILPNNKNIILAAEQAQKLASEQGLQVAVIPSKNFTQALAAMLVYNPEEGLEDNQQKMTEALTTIKAGNDLCGEDSQLNGLSISKVKFLAWQKARL